jgi:hypothetical protein
LNGERIVIREEAAKWGMSASSMYDVVNGDSYKHVDPSVEWPDQPATPVTPRALGEEEMGQTPFEQLYCLWSRLTEGERQEFLSKIAVARGEKGGTFSIT